jgi:hypothetical protein
MAAKSKSPPAHSDRAAVLAQRLSDALLQERIVPRFVDTYVVDHGRYGLQVHAALYRDLLSLLQREALLAASAYALEAVCKGGVPNEDRRFTPRNGRDAAAFRQKYLAALTRHQHWNVATALDFQSDLQIYESILLRAHSARRTRKAFEAANHPFVDRCAFMLDSSFLENARVAASRALASLEALASQILAEVLGQSKHAAH